MITQVSACMRRAMSDIARPRELPAAIDHIVVVAIHVASSVHSAAVGSAVAFRFGVLARGFVPIVPAMAPKARLPRSYGAEFYPRSYGADFYLSCMVHMDWVTRHMYYRRIKGQGRRILAGILAELMSSSDLLDGKADGVKATGGIIALSDKPRPGRRQTTLRDHGFAKKVAT